MKGNRQGFLSRPIKPFPKLFPKVWETHAAWQKYFFDTLCGAAEAAPLVVYAVVSIRTSAVPYSAVARYRKVTTWPLVQVASGLKVVSEVPFVIPFSTAQATAFS